jgi:plasmid maintenance system antidote protein VapI
MPVQDSATLKSYFERGDKPTQAEFDDLIDTLFSMLTGSSLSDAAYSGAWNGDTNHAPSKNVVYDKFEAVIAACLAVSMLDTDGTLAANSDAKIASQKAIRTYVVTQIAALVNSSPVTLDTLKELADALGDDPNFATTMATALGLRELLSNKDTDGTLAANSDTNYPSQKAVKTYADLRELLSNKDIDGTLAANSDIKYPSQKAVKTYVVAQIAALINSSPITLDTLKELADALGDDPNFATTMATALGLRELLSNKDTDGTLAANSDTKYPSQKAVKTYADLIVANFQKAVQISATASGTNTYTATLAPVPASLASLWCLITFTNANTTAATINVNSLGAKDIKKADGSALSSGDIPAGSIQLLVYNGTYFQIVGGSSSASIASSYPFYNEGATNKTYTIDAKSVSALTLTQIRGLATASGTCTITIKINGTAVTFTGSVTTLNVTSTPQDVSIISGGVIAAGDRITYTITSAAAPVDLEATLK